MVQAEGKHGHRRAAKTAAAMSRRAACDIDPEEQGQTYAEASAKSFTDGPQQMQSDG